MNELTSLPGMGRETALRLALHMLHRNVDYTENFIVALITPRRGVKHCRVCHSICDDGICSICANPNCNHSLVRMVENTKEVMTIGNTGQFHGVYHVLGGIVSPTDSIGPSDLRAGGLVQRMAEDEVKEIALALSATMEGGTINFFICRKLSGYDMKISVIVRGISINDEIEYTGEITLGRSVINHTEFNLTSFNS